MLGSDGIAVGMRTQIFPHNFKELLNAQIAILEKRPFKIYPDFPQGGIMDVSEYEDGAGKIRLRARIEADGEKKLVIREIPATTTTESLIESISRAVRRGKLKITSINDYTAENVEIEINLARGVYAEEAIKELYAYTDCELSIRSTLLVICENVPVEMTVSEVLQRNTEKLLDILKRELELELQREEDRFHDRSLVRIFIENRIYKRIEKCDSLEKILSETRKGLEAFRHLLHRDISDEDIEKLLQIHIRRISLFDLNRMTEELESILDQMEKTKFNLAHLTEYTIQMLHDLLEKYGPLYPRLTKIEGFETVNVREIARADLKVWHDKLNYFVGTHVKGSNKNDEPLICTEFDRLMLLKNDGTCKVIAVPEKEYIGATKYLFLADKEQVYSILYRDRQEGTWYAKRFQLGQFILSKEYQIIPPNCLIEHLYTNSSVVVRLELAVNNRRSYNTITVDFDSSPLRSREARGFKLTHYPVTAVTVLNRGTSATETTDNQENTEKEKPTPAEQSADQPAPENEIIADSPEHDHEDELNSIPIPAAEEDQPETIQTEIPIPVPAPLPVAEKSPKPKAKRSGTKKSTSKKTSNFLPSEEKPAFVPAAPAVQPDPVEAPISTSSLPASAAFKPVKSPSIAAPAISAPASAKPAAASPPSPEQKPAATPVQPAPATDEKKPKALKKLIDEDTPFFLE